MSDLGNRTVMARNIEYYMKKNRNTRKEVCKALNFPYSTFCEWVSGNAYPRIDKIEQMAEFWQIEKSDLIENHDTYKQANDVEFAKEFLEEKMLKRWLNEVGETHFNDNEMTELINFAKYIVSKRGDK